MHIPVGGHDERWRGGRKRDSIKSCTYIRIHARAITIQRNGVKLLMYRTVHTHRGVADRHINKMPVSLGPITPPGKQEESGAECIGRLCHPMQARLGRRVPTTIVT